MLVASTSVFGFNCTTPAAVTWRTPPSPPRASGYRSSESASGRRVAKGERPHHGSPTGARAARSNQSSRRAQR